MNMQWNRDIQYVKGVGEVKARSFRRLGVDTLLALLRFYPRAYEDWSKIYTVADAPEGIPCCVSGVLAFPPETKRLPGNRILVRTALVDGAEVLGIVFFNNKYVVSSLHEGEEYIFFGKVERDA